MRTFGVIALAAASLAGGMLAQQPDSKSGMTGMHNQMMADMKAMDAKLDQKLAAMNAAKGPEKMDAMAAVLNEMAAQHKDMMAKMSGMHGQMMMGAKDTKGKEADPHQGHHAE